MAQEEGESQVKGPEPLEDPGPLEARRCFLSLGDVGRLQALSALSGLVGDFLAFFE